MESCSGGEVGGPLGARLAALARACRGGVRAGERAGHGDAVRLGDGRLFEGLGHDAMRPEAERDGGVVVGARFELHPPFGVGAVGVGEALLPEGAQGRERGDQRGDVVVVDEVGEGGGDGAARAPFVVEVFDPEERFEAVGDGEAAVGLALGDDALRPEVHGKVRPVVFAGREGVPGRFELFLPGFMLGDEAPEGGGGEDDAVVEIGAPEGGDALDFVEHGAQLFDEGGLVVELAALGGGGERAGGVDEVGKAAVFEGELGGDEVVLDLEEGVFGDAVGVEPDGITGRGGAELPDDGGLAAALGVALEVVLEVGGGDPGAEVVGFGGEEGGGFLVAGVGGVAEDKVEDGANMLELLEFYRTEGYSESDSLNNVKRVFRGGVASGGAPSQLTFIGHQANLRMLEAIAKRCEVPPERHRFNVDRRGNTGAAGAPSVLSELWDAKDLGAAIALCVVGSGLTWAGALLQRQ